MKIIRKQIGVDGYLAMIRQFPLRPIRNQADSEQATEILDQYFGRDDLDAGVADYVQVLAGLLADYEESKYPIDTSGATPVALLKHLMQANDMTTAELGRLLGNSGLASMILHGKRSISKANAHVLAKRFGLNAGAFI